MSPVVMSERLSDVVLSRCLDLGAAAFVANKVLKPTAACPCMHMHLLQTTTGVQNLDKIIFMRFLYFFSPTEKEETPVEDSRQLSNCSQFAGWGNEMLFVYSSACDQKRLYCAASSRELETWGEHLKNSHPTER